MISFLRILLLISVPSIDGYLHFYLSYVVSQENIRTTFYYEKNKHIIWVMFYYCVVSSSFNEIHQCLYYAM